MDNILILIGGLTLGIIVTYIIASLNKNRKPEQSYDETLQSQLNETVTNLRVAETQLSQQQQENGRLNQKIESQNEENTQLTTKVSVLETTIQNDNQRISDLSNRLSEITTINESKQSTINSLNQGLSEKNATVTSLSDNLKSQKEIQSAQSQDLKSLNEKLTETTSENSTLSAQNATLTENSNSMKETVKKQSDQIDSLTGERNKLQTENSALNANNNALKEKITTQGEELKSQKEIQSTQSLDLKSLNKKLTETTSENSTLSAQNSALTESCNSMKETVQKQSEKIIFLTGQRDKLQTENSALNANNNALTEKITAQSEELKSQKEIQSTQSQDLKSLNEKLTETTSENSTLSAQNSALTESCNSMKETVKKQSEQIDSLTGERNKLQTENSALNANNNALTEKLTTQKEEMLAMQKTAHLQFEKIATQILEEKSGRFTEVNKVNIEAILKPLGENIDSFKKQVAETYDKESKQRFSLEGKIKDLVEQTNKVSDEANNLATALKVQTKKQGNWGEMILESILQQSGLVKDREYFMQQTIKDDEGNNLRPDVLIKLPDNRVIIIDSKVSLVAYDRFSSSNANEQSGYLNEHLKSVRTHIDALSDKQYDNSIKESLDFTMMFVPIEPAYLLAIQNDQTLWEYAYLKRILLISPTNLIACLKLMNDLWKRELQSRNAQEIVKRGEKLYEKFVSFVNTIEDVGTHIDRTQKSYDKAFNLLKNGRDNLIVQATKLKNLGLNPSKEISVALLPADIEIENEE
jgi:DNA recombination protein RmuC